MTEQERLRLERRASLLKCLAHPSRLLIVELLEKGPRCVADLIEAIGADKTTVSKHLAVLKKAGLVRDKRRGTRSDYELVCGCVSPFIDCIEKTATTEDGAEVGCAAGIDNGSGVCATDVIPGPGRSCRE